MNKYIEDSDLEAFAGCSDGMRSMSERDVQQALHRVIFEGKRQFVEAILQRLKNVNFSYEMNDWTPLHIAVEMGDRDIVEMLLAAGADIMQSDGSGSTPLHLAVDAEADSAFQADQKPVPDVSKLLLAAGADPFIPDSNGASALDVAREYEYKEFIQLVESQHPAPPAS